MTAPSFRPPAPKQNKTPHLFLNNIILIGLAIKVHKTLSHLEFRIETFVSILGTEMLPDVVTLKSLPISAVCRALTF